MTVDPFIEAEEVAGHSVQNACRLLEVSKSAYYQRRNGVPSARRRQRRRAAREDQGHPRRVQGHLWRPADPQGAAASPRGLREAQGDQAHASRPASRGGARSAGARPPSPTRRRVGRAISSSATSGRATRWTGAMSATSPTSPPGRAGPTWPRSSTWPLAGSSAGPWPITCAPSWSKTPSPWPSTTGHHERGVIFHSDRGCQYTSGDFAELARANGVVLSVGRKGECWDNAVAESFFATIKRELIDTRAWPTRAGLRRAVFEYIEGWYNTRRLHSTLGYLSPAQYEAVHHNADRQAA